MINDFKFKANYRVRVKYIELNIVLAICIIKP